MTLLKRLFLLAVLILGVGCSAPKKISYFQDLDEGTQITLPADAELRLTKGDKLSIVVHSRRPELASQFNLSVSSQRIGFTSLNNGSYLMSSYIVADDGTLDFPGVGTLSVEGLTRAEVVSLVKASLKEKDYFIDDEDFIVTVEFDNMFFSILGEVARPNRYAITKDKLNIFEALGMAGDMSIQGQRTNVKLIREEGNTRKVYMLDFTDGNSVMTSPAYYIKQGDVIYVEANNYRKRQATVNGNNVRSGSFWISITSVLTSVILMIMKF